MSEQLLHEPKVMTDNESEVYYVKCALCGKILWFPEMDDECNPPPPALGVSVSDGVGTKDKFG
jgi:hypothetical protein